LIAEAIKPVARAGVYDLVGAQSWLFPFGRRLTGSPLATV
jgi:hypothetical protein